MAKAKTTEFLPREPEGSIAAQFKSVPVDDLLGTLGPATALLTTEPMSHQAASLAIGLQYNSWLFALDMGLGKTKIALDIFTVRRAMGEAIRMLVIVPPIVLHHWRNEIYKHSKHTVALVEGKPKEKLDTFYYAQEDIIVVSSNWLTLQYPSKGRKKHTGLPHNDLVEIFSRFDMVVVDEAHVLRSHQNKAFKGFVKYLIDIPLRYLLTGTPIGNEYTGVWALYYLLDEGETYGETFHKFSRRFFYVFYVNDRWPVYRLLKDKRADFFDLFWRRAVRWEETECADLPEKSYMNLPVTMEGKQLQAYNQFLAEAEEKELPTEHVTYPLMRLTSGVGETWMSPKLEAIQYIAEEVVKEREDYLIIWHWLQDEGDLIASHLRKKLKIKVAEVRGNISDTKKKKALEDWHAGKVRCLVANPRSLGIGVDLYEARLAVYFSNSFSVIDRRQSEKRIHRKGQTRPVKYIDLVCEDSIDEYILEQLGSAQEAFAGLTGDRLVKLLKAKKKKK